MGKPKKRCCLPTPRKLRLRRCLLHRNCRNGASRSRFRRRFHVSVVVAYRPRTISFHLKYLRTHTFAQSAPDAIFIYVHFHNYFSPFRFCFALPIFCPKLRCFFHRILLKLALFQRKVATAVLSSLKTALRRLHSASPRTNSALLVLQQNRKNSFAPPAIPQGLLLACVLQLRLHNTYFFLWRFNLLRLASCTTKEDK